MFKIGDEVRLVRGWTRMIVIGITPDNEIIAKYDHGTNDHWNQVTLEDYKNPECAHLTYTRPMSGFAAWDGKPAERMHPMPNNQYNITRGAYKGSCGTFLNKTSTGKFVLELTNGDVVTVAAKSVSEVVPFTFEAKAIANNYRYTYEAPEGSTICEGDLLMSNSGNVYAVLQTNTKSRYPKSVFAGRRLVTEAL